MRREDFAERGERKVDFLKYYRLVSRWACKNNDLKVADLELLLYLDPIKYFTVQDFKDGTIYYSWDNTRFYRLQREGWIEKFHNSKGAGDHSKYKVSYKGKRLINQIYKILIGEEDLPESDRRNKIMKRKTYIDKVYSQAIKKFNKESNF